MTCLEYPGEGHALAGTEAQAHAVQSVVSFLTAHLKKPDAGDATEVQLTGARCREAVAFVRLLRRAADRGDGDSIIDVCGGWRLPFPFDRTLPRFAPWWISPMCHGAWCLVHLDAVPQGVLRAHSVSE